MKQWKKWLAMALAVAVVTPTQLVTQTATMTAEASETVWLTDADLEDEVATAPESWGAVPNEEQLWYMKEGLAAFCHFGPNTYNNVEWGQSYGTQSPNQIFHLDNAFDAEQLVKDVKEAGFGRLILTCKHHDGLCLWDTKTTNYSVAKTDNAEAYGGDILEALSDACTEYNLDMGCYLSPWDIHEDKYGCFGSEEPLPGGHVNTEYTDYNDLYIAQIREICTAVKTDEAGNPILDEEGNPVYKYGNNNPNRRSDRFVEWWMDGATGATDKQTLDWTGIIGAIRESNPDCQIFGTGKAAVNYANPEDVPLASTGGIHWIGNESGFASETTWAKVNAGSDYEALRKTVPQGHAIEGNPEGDVWSVPEVDVKMLAGWFWRDSAGDNTTKSDSTLAKIYFESVGRGATLLLNLSPNKEGTVGEQQMNAFKKLGQNIKDTFAVDMTKAEGVTAKATSVWGNSKAYSASQVLDEIPEGEVYDETYWAPENGQTTGSLEIDLGGLKTFDLVSLEEYIQKGQTIKSFTIEYKNAIGRWEEFATGTTISSLRLCRRSAVEGSAIRVTINDAYSTPMLVNVGVYKMVEDFEVAEENKGPVMPTNLPYISIMDFTLTDTSNGGAWTKENNNTSAWSNAQRNGVATFTFTGTQAWIMGTLDSAHGTMDVYIDDVKITSVNTNASVRQMNALLYTTPELEYGEHTVKLACTQNAIGLAGAYYQDGSGVFSLSHESMSMLYGETAEIQILREGGSKGQVEVTYYTESSGAEQGVDYINLTDTVVFEEGETSKTITLTGLVNERNVDGKDFFFTLADVQKIVGEEKQPASMGETDYAHIRLYTVNPELILENARKVDTADYSEETVEAFEEAIRVLELCMESELSTESALLEAAKAVLDAQNALAEPVEEEGDTEEPTIFTLPSLVGEEKLLEAESFTLDASGAADTNKYVRITQFTFENKVYDEVNWFENGNKIKKKFFAPEAGTYTFTAKYRSGRGSGNPNAFVWSGTNIQNGELTVHGESSANTYRTAELTIEVTQPGEGELIFTADDRGGPVIDSFTVTFTDATKTERAVESVSLNVEELALTAEKQSGILIATVLPKDATNKAVTFESSAPEVIAVDNNGVVKALKDGEAVITVKTVNGELTDTCTVTAEVELGLAEIALNNAVKAAQLLVSAGQGNYTQETWDAFVAAYNAAQEVEENATKETLNELAETLTAAQEALVENEGGDDNQGGTEGEGGNQGGTEEEQHTPSKDWSKDETNHWHACTFAGCTENQKHDVAAHTWNKGEVTKQPSATATGEKTFTCTVCGQTKKEVVPAMGTAGGNNNAQGGNNNTQGGNNAAVQEQQKVEQEKAEIDALKTQGANLKTDEYTKDSWNAYQAALNKVNTLISSGKATSAELNQAKVDLKTAFGALVKAPATQTPEEKPAEVVKPGVTFKNGTYQFKITSATEAQFTGVASSIKTVKIANTISYGGKTLKVTSVANKALKGDKVVTKVVLGSNIKNIGNSAFEGCTKLTSVNLKNVTKIGNKAFKKCTSLKKVTIPKKVTNLGKSVFEGCSKLSTITIKATALKRVGKNTFKSISAKAKIKVPKKNLANYKKILKNKGQGKKVTIK